MDRTLAGRQEGWKVMRREVSCEEGPGKPFREKEDK